MNTLEVIRAQFQKAREMKQKAQQQAPEKLPILSTVKEFPLRNQNQNRLVQVMHRESFAASDIYTTKLHRGILNDWLGAFEENGQILLPNSSLLSIANAALWNSQARFNHLSSGFQTSTSQTEDIWNSSVCVADFHVMKNSHQPLVVTDTRTGNIPQSQSTCIQTVVSDSGEVKVYHHAIDGTTQLLAQGRVSSAHVQVQQAVAATEAAVLTTSTKCAVTSTGIQDLVTANKHLRDCYDLPPSLLESVLHRALLSPMSATPDSELLSQLQNQMQGLSSPILHFPYFWLNQNKLSNMWDNPRGSQVNSALSADGHKLQIWITTSSSCTADSSSKSAAVVIMYGEVDLLSALVNANSDTTVISPVCTSRQLPAMWELHARWEDRHTSDLTTTTSRSNGAHTAAVPPQRMLLLGEVDTCAQIKSSIAEAVVDVGPLNFHLTEQAQTSVSADVVVSASENKYDTVVVVLPFSAAPGMKFKCFAALF